jgi:RHS repeat-associated protein
LTAALFAAFFAGPAQAMASAKPDLRVTAASAPATVSANGVLAISATVRNAGKGAARASTTAFFLSRDRKAGKDIKLGTAKLGQLGALLSASSTVELVLKSSIRPGKYYVVVCADSGRKVAESSEKNNCRVDTHAVKVSKAHPELVVSATAGAPAVLRADRHATLSVTVRNRGGKPSAAATLTVLVSTDAAAGAGDVRAGALAVPKLGARAKLTRTVLLTIPYTLAGGPYHLLACLGKACRAAGAPEVVEVLVNAPSNPKGVPTDFSSSVAFLYSGAGAPQHGVTPGAIKATRVAVLRGRVLARNGQPVGGVRVSAVGHPELGFTYTRVDGMFDLAVNGGGQLNVDYRTAGYLPVQRIEAVPWQDFTMVPDVVLTPLDSAVTKITSGSPAWQAHRANSVTDSDGTRRATLLFAPGTHASLRMQDGSLQAAASIMVRATEYTTGPDGLAAMPGTLPPSTGFTYAVDYSADEAIAAGAAGVSFDKPVITYTDDFLGFPVGAAVPAGTYDAGAGHWAADPNGVIVKVISVTNGAATLDVNGDGAADTGAALTALGITSGELAELGKLYTAGATLMRVPRSHFSSADYNYEDGPPNGSTGPGGGPQNDSSGGNCMYASIVICESQTLGERIPVTGTPYSLVYGSDRVPGRVMSRSFNIQLRPATMPVEPLAIHMTVEVAGQTIAETFPATQQTATFTWNGLDAYGRPVQGWVDADVAVGYEYAGQYYATRADTDKSFGELSGFDFTVVPAAGTRRPQVTGVVSVPARINIIVWKTWQTTLGSWDERGLGLGGWVLDPVEVYDRDAGMLQNGDGTTERADQTAYESVAPVAGNGLFNGPVGDGGPATSARLNSPDGLAVSPDGTIYIADNLNGTVRKITADGTITSVYGDPATTRPADVAAARDGSIYIADAIKHEIVHVQPDGTKTIVAGTGTAGYTGDGGPATAAKLNTPNAIAIGPDDSIWFMDSWPSPPDDARVRRIAPDGTISTAIGGGPAPLPANPYGDGLQATQVRIAYINGNGIAVGPDGTVYLCDVGPNGSFIREIGTDGLSHRFAGGGSPPPGSVGDGGLATAALLNGAKSLAVGPDGSVYIGEASRVRRVNPDGTIETIAGGPTAGYGGDNGPAAAALMSSVWALAVSPNGDVIFADHGNNRIRAIRSVLRAIPVGAVSLASADGSEVYRFDAAGHHVQTLDGMTGTVLRQFGYDSAGRLTTITDQHGLVTTIEHDASGDPTAIVAPGGQRTTLATDGNGYLASITDPVGSATQFTYSGSGGLLATLTDGRGDIHHFGYDGLGLLTSDQNPAGGQLTLARTTLTDGDQVTVTTAQGRQTLYRFELKPDGSVSWAQTDPSGAVSSQIEHPDGTVTETSASGRIETLTTGPDPRFGERVAVVTKDVIAEPSGPTSTVTAARTMTTQPGGGIATLTDTVTRNGQTWTQEYVAAGKTETVTSPAGRTDTLTLDAADDVSSFQQGSLTPTTFTYDVRGRLTQIAQGSAQEDRGYDSGDRMTTDSDGAGNVTTYGYDADGRVTSITRPSGGTFSIHRDANGNIDGVDLPGTGAPHDTITNDSLDRLATFTAPGRGTLARAYTLDGQPDTLTEPGGAVIGYAYDAGGRPTTDTFPEGTTTQTYSDTTGRVATATRAPTSGTSQVSTFTYQGDLITGDTQTGNAAGVFHYAYSNDLDVSSWSLDGAASTITRDADRLVTGDGPWTETIDANRLETTFANGGDTTDNITYTYDALGRETSRIVTVNNTPVNEVDLAYDTAGRIASSQASGDSAARVYSYDVDGRLASVTGGETGSYSYDARDNMTQSPAGTATYTADDRVSSVGATAYTYDADGRLATRGTDTFTYSARGELLSTQVGATTVTYGYDAAGRRVSRTVGATTTQYLYGSMTNAVELTASKQGGVTTTYRYDAAGDLAAIERGANRYLVATDAVGSPIAVYDAATGAAVVQRTYDAFGRLTSESDSLGLPVGYAGGLTDPVTHLVRFGARDYDPDLGRFTAPDPTLFASGQFNLYAYVADDPVDGTDPRGLDESNQCLPPEPKKGYTCGTSGMQKVHERQYWQQKLNELRGDDRRYDPHYRGAEKGYHENWLQSIPDIDSDGKPTSAAAFASCAAAARG